VDPITLIVTALVAGVAAGATSVAEQTVKEAYAGLKDLIRRRFGDQGDVALAVEQLERNPDSSARQELLREELASASAGQDADVLQAARDLLALVRPNIDTSQTATGRGAATVGDGNIAITGDVQGGVTIIQGAAPAPAASPAVPAAPDMGDHHLAVVRDLLLAAFTAPDLRRLFQYTANTELRPLAQASSPSDGLTAMVDRVIEFCHTRDLLPDLLAEIQRANPRQYAHFAPRLHV
jgi:hypothetical protein